MSSTLKSSSKMTKSQLNDLILLTARMQKNADTVEKDVLGVEDLLVIDADNDKRNLPFKHQKESSDCLSEAEGLLKDLFLDLDKVKKMKHPQAEEIEKDVSQLHERWLKDCGFYRYLYKQMNEIGLQPRINQIQVFNQKQACISGGEKSTSNKTKWDMQSTNGSQLNDLILLSARMQKNADTVEKDVLRVEDLLVIDADNDKRNLPFKHQKESSDCLSKAEGLLKDLFLDLDKVKKMKHPQAGEIEKDVSQLHEHWLKDCGFYHHLYKQMNEIGLQPRINQIQVFNQKQYQLDAENLSESLTRLSSTLDPKSLSKKSNTETACISGGEKSTSNKTKWDMQSTNGSVNSFPRVCLTIPPPDTEAINRVDLLDKELDDQKKRRAAVRASLKTQASETSRAGSLFKPLENPKVIKICGCPANCLNEQEEDDCYPMTKRPLGHCLIINNYIFEEGCTYKNRKGTDADKDALIRVFSRMHFSVVERRDLVSSDMINTVKEFAEMDHSKMDVFVCCILSHGEKGTVVGTDGEPVRIRDLTQHFAQCPTLTGKPKLFFIQACQGDELQRGVWEQDGFEEGDEEYEDDGKKNSRLPIEADFLIGMATVESYKSFRHTNDGSIFIQELCKQLTNGCPKQEDILSILTKVNRKVGAQELNGKKQMPEPRYTLTKKLVLPMD